MKENFKLKIKPFKYDNKKFVIRLRKAMPSFEPLKPIGIMFLWSFGEIVDCTQDLVMRLSMIQNSFNDLKKFTQHIKHMIEKSNIKGARAKYRVYEMGQMREDPREGYITL